jgi:hypothetical protein
MPKHPSHILELAKRGAEHRIQVLTAEIDTLQEVLAHLRGRGRRQTSVLDAVTGGPAPVVGRRRKPMSAAAKKAVSLRMKKYWAKRKAAAKKG